MELTAVVLLGIVKPKEAILAENRLGVGSKDSAAVTAVLHIYNVIVVVNGHFIEKFVYVRNAEFFIFCFI